MNLISGKMPDGLYMIGSTLSRIWQSIWQPSRSLNIKQNPLSGTLVVEDDLIALQIVCCKLKTMGIKQVTAVNSACDALRFLSSHDVDLIITDWNMPYMSGLELLNKLRANSEYDDVPILMVTCNGEPAQINQAIMAGATRYIVKPVNSAVLEMNVAYCQMWRAERQFRKI